VQLGLYGALEAYGESRIDQDAAPGPGEFSDD